METSLEALGTLDLTPLCCFGLVFSILRVLQVIRVPGFGDWGPGLGAFGTITDKRTNDRNSPELEASLLRTAVRQLLPARGLGHER